MKDPLRLWYIERKEDDGTTYRRYVSSGWVARQALADIKAGRCDFDADRDWEWRI